MPARACQQDDYNRGMSVFGRWVLAEMARRRWTHQRLADAAGVGRTTVTTWLAGQRVPDTVSLLKLAVALNIHRYVIIDVVARSLEHQEAALVNTSGPQDVTALPLFRVGSSADEPTTGHEPEVFLWDAPFPLVDMGDYFALAMDNGDLEPDISEGEIAIIHRRGQILAGCLVCVIVEGRYRLRRVSRRGSVYFVADNDPMTLMPLREAEVVGVVLEKHLRRLLYPPTE